MPISTDLSKSSILFGSGIAQYLWLLALSLTARFAELSGELVSGTYYNSAVTYSAKSGFLELIRPIVPQITFNVQALQKMRDFKQFRMSESDSITKVTSIYMSKMSSSQCDV